MKSVDTIIDTRIESMGKILGSGDQIEPMETRMEKVETDVNETMKQVNKIDKRMESVEKMMRNIKSLLEKGNQGYESLESVENNEYRHTIVQKSNLT